MLFTSSDRDEAYSTAMMSVLDVRSNKFYIFCVIMMQYMYFLLLCLQLHFSHVHICMHTLSAVIQLISSGPNRKMI